MKTLYISDLDGTLLNNKSKITSHTADLLNRISDNGVLFTVATARTLSTTVPILSGLRLKCPLVLMNGVCLFDPVKKKTILTHGIDHKTGRRIEDIFHKYGKYPLVYFEKNSKMRVEYQKLTTQSQKDYVGLRQQFYHKDFIQVDDFSFYGDNNFIYVVTLDKKEEIDPIYREICSMQELDCNFYMDTYSGEYFLEISTKGVSKASGALWVKEKMNADRLVAFGDNMNDLALFQIADESYATSNACEELKSAATGVIGSNEEDAVAEYIFKRYCKEK